MMKTLRLLGVRGRGAPESNVLASCVALTKKSVKKIRRENFRGTEMFLKKHIFSKTFRCREICVVGFFWTDFLLELRTKPVRSIPVPPRPLTPNSRRVFIIRKSQKSGNFLNMFLANNESNLIPGLSWVLLIHKRWTPNSNFKSVNGGIIFYYWSSYSLDFSLIKE